MARARALLAALLMLAATPRPAQAGAIIKPAKIRGGFQGAVQDALRGPEILPNGAGVRLEGTTGVLRTLELDDTTTLHLRLSIPF